VSRAATSDLVSALERSLGSAVAGIARRPSDTQSSFALEELDVELAEGPALPLVFKDLGPSALDPAAREAKPGFLYDPLREIEVYTRLLTAELGTPHCHGAAVDVAAGRYWLFLERVAGVELYQVGLRSTWEHVAARLAGMHRVLAGRGCVPSRLVRYDAELLHRWARRAVEYAPPERRAPLERIAERYDRVVERILALPAAPIHGEFYAANVLVDDAREPARVCPVDWEVAALGPGLIDLAALVSGRWDAGDRAALAAAYREALPAGARPSVSAFSEALDACRLHVALQWLGWSATWSPPPEQATDWFGDALELSRSLGL
jgi:Ser/Thr protein kinase RdoA (MazF antagonist)